MRNKMKYLLILFLSILIFSSCATTNKYELKQNNKEISFPDLKLEESIRRAIGKREGPIFSSDLEKLTTFEAIDQGITSLDGIENCKNLTMLFLDNNEIADIQNLAYLKELSGLSVTRNKIIDLAPLSSLTNLKQLDLNFNKITDISALVSLTNLETLNLAGSTNGNQIVDISSLASITGLKNIWLANNRISDVSALVHLANPKMINLDGNPLSDDSINKYIPQLKAKGAQVHALYLIPN